MFLWRSLVTLVGTISPKIYESESTCIGILILGHLAEHGGRDERVVGVAAGCWAKNMGLIFTITRMTEILLPFKYLFNIRVSSR